MAKDNPIITTIIPTFNRAQLLKGAIKSVLNQSYPNFNILVLDNASTDNTKEVVEEFSKLDARVKYHRHLNNIGLAANFQYGYVNVDTQFFSFFSDDDLLLPNFYELAVKKLKEHPEAGFFAGASIVGNDKHIALSSLNSNGECLSLLKTKRWDLFDKLCGLIWTSVLFKREVLVKCERLDTSITSFDTDFLLKAALNYPFIASSELCAFFRTHSSGYSNLQNEQSMYVDSLYQEILKINENLTLFTACEGDKKEIKDHLLRFYKRLTIPIIYHFLLNKQLQKGKSLIAFLEENFSLTRSEKSQLLLLKHVVCKPLLAHLFPPAMALRRQIRARLQFGKEYSKIKNMVGDLFQNII